jgi:hypothetical protein
MSWLSWWPRLLLAVRVRPWPSSRPGIRPAGSVLARPRLLRRVRAGPALTRTGRRGSLVAGRACRPLRRGSLVSRWLPGRPCPRRPPRRGPLVRLSRPARGLSLEGLSLEGLALEVLSLEALSLEVLLLIARCLLLARVPLSRVPARPRTPRPRRPPGLTLGTGRSRPSRLTSRSRRRSWRVRVRPRTPGVREARRRPRAAGRRRTLLPGTRLARGRLPRARARRARPGTANPRHRVLGTLPGPVGRRGVVDSLPAGTRRVAGPRRVAALRPGARRPWRHVRGARSFALPAARVALVAGVDGVSVGFEVGIPLVGVPLRVGSTAGPAARASVRPAALTIHPAPPGHTVRRSPPQIECRAVTLPGQGRRVIAPSSIPINFAGGKFISPPGGAARVSYACR